MEVKKIDHIGIAVRDLEVARKVWEPILGKTKPDDEFADEGEKIKVARYNVGEVALELVQATSPESDVAKLIEKRGEGFMLLALNVERTREAVNELKTKDYPFVGGTRTFRDSEFAFIHPKKMTGVLLELTDYKPSEPEST